MCTLTALNNENPITIMSIKYVHNVLLSLGTQATSFSPENTIWRAFLNKNDLFKKILVNHLRGVYKFVGQPLYYWVLFSVQYYNYNKQGW